MGSNGDRSQIPLQLEFVADGSIMLVKTNLYLTVDEFKLDVAHLTGIPADQQILMYKGFLLENPHSLVTFEVEPNQTIQVHSSQPPNSSLSGESTPASGGTYRMDETKTFDNKPQSEHPSTIMDILNTLIHTLLEQYPEVTRMLDRIDARVLSSVVKVFPLYLLFLGIETRLKHIQIEGFDKPEETEENQSSLCGSSNLVNTPVTLHDDELLKPIWRILRNVENDAEIMSARSSRGGIDATEKRLLLATLEEKFAMELKVMEQQGFMDRVKNIRALVESEDDVQKAIEKLKEKLH